MLKRKREKWESGIERGGGREREEAGRKREGGKGKGWENMAEVRRDLAR